ncbi:hypothetical protein PLESTB_000504000 [Pleodorina starrii]|uniref:Uncharacterized protein n=1 Tax=Pleodorina starrii TaxID=330485 RepID=A0A9W6BG75_9CHLO|nr:hypothetical protein PLESTM_001772600 [Pleodorina starrii]GLC51453.1 hypothetical protein PLESTB_000504000 [Pleodorina starrii]GLC67729.1 hypothetical protein PLESTF_000599400 [Pleodorina starrii]
MSKPTGAFPRKADLPDPSVLCKDEKLAASTRNIANLADPEYWAAICPELSVNGTLKAKPLIKSKDYTKGLQQQINDEGVFQLCQSETQWPIDIHRLARNMVTLMQHGWPATFLLMFDEVWALIHRASALMAATTGGNACNMDVLCWYVDPNRGDAGFSPHRDRQPDDSPATFRASDGSPMYSTCWVPLTDACPENSCLYMVPRWADPGYFKGDDDDGPDPLNVALASKEAFQSIRAFPAVAGSAIVFTHRIIHWGSRGRKGYHTPRLAVSWGCADDAYEPPYFSREHLPYPPMALRAALACGQMLAYHERFTMSRRQLSLYYKYFTAHAGEFHESYRAKVKLEFVAATKEVVAAAPAAAAVATAAADGARSSEDGGGKGAAVEKGKEGKKKGKKGAAEGAAAAAAAAAAPEENGATAEKTGKKIKEEKIKRTEEEKKREEEEEKKKWEEGGKKKKKVKKNEEEEKKRKEEEEEKKRGKEEAEKKKKKKKRAAEDGPGDLSAGAGGSAAGAKVGTGAESAAAAKSSKKAKKAVAGSGEEAAAAAAEVVQTSKSGKKAAAAAAAGKAAAAAAEEEAAAAAAKAATGDKKKKKKKEEKASKDKTSAGKAAAAAEAEVAAKKAEGGRAAVARRLLDDYHNDDDDGDDDSEEEGPGWEALLQGTGTGGGELESEDEVMEEALDALLDEELEGRGEGLQDDFDDFAAEDM